LKVPAPGVEVEAAEVVDAVDTLFVERVVEVTGDVLEKAAEVTGDTLEAETTDVEALVVELVRGVVAWEMEGWGVEVVAAAVLMTGVEVGMETEAVKDKMLCVLAAAGGFVVVPPTMIVPPGPSQVSSTGQHPPRPLSPVVHTFMRGQ
jgi:hypothetical protein